MQPVIYHRVPLTVRLLEAFIRHRWLFLITAATVTGVGSGVLYTRGKSYSATGSIRVTSDDTAQVLGALAGDRTTVTMSIAEQNVQQFRDLLNDDKPGGFLATALANAHLDRPISIDPKANDKRYAQLLKSVKIDAPSANLFNVSLTWDNPGECERITSALQAQYIEEVGRAKQAKSLATEEFLDKQIASYAERMRSAEKVLIAFKQNNLGQLPEAESSGLRQLGTLRAQLDELHIKARDNELRKQALQQRITQVKPTSLKEQTLADDPLARQLKQYQAERDLLLVDYLPNSDEVQSMDARIAALKRLIAERAKTDPGRQNSIVETKVQENPAYQALQQQLTEANIATKTFASQIQLLQQQISDYTARIARMPAAQRVLNDNTRNYSILKSQYEALLARREQAEIKGNLDRVSASSDYRPIGVVNALPSTGSVKMLLMMIGCAAAGLVCSSVLVILREWTDPTLRYEDDAERLLELPVLASIPEAPDMAQPALVSKLSTAPPSLQSPA